MNSAGPSVAHVGFSYAPLLSPWLHPTFSVLKSRDFRLYLKEEAKITAFDHEAGAKEAGSASNLEFSRAFRCSRRIFLRSATQSLASSNLLGAEKP
ncbi:hypothetical protein LMZ02_13085 [Paenibacillus macerans]|uniref:hypothetical protein n=1 Tax=Paenibacillus macerans TaxID=44252 RepID=UPI001F0EE4EE|nr:hypothetical protein [Paenibacillus macerans]UMV50223.1 hypothetical protein LMZ02_13085 [Paenibacillus macerans]